MVHIQVSEHRFVEIRRRSLCENCSVRNCTSFDGSRVTECNRFKPLFLVLLKCRECGRVYDPYQSLRSLDYALCPECNHIEKGDMISFVCRE